MLLYNKKYHKLYVLAAQHRTINGRIGCLDTGQKRNIARILCNLVAGGGVFLILNTKQKESNT